MSVWIFSRKILQTAPLSSLLAVMNPCLCCHGFIKMTGEEETSPPFIYVLNCCHKQRPRFISLGILEVKAAPIPITMLCAGKGQQERCGSLRHLVVDLQIFWVSDKLGGLLLPAAPAFLEVRSNHHCSLSFPLSTGFEQMCFLASDTSLENNHPEIIHALHHPALQGNKPLRFAAWLCFFKKLGGWGGGKEIRKIAVVRETLIKMFLVYPWGKRRAPTFI